MFPFLSSKRKKQAEDIQTQEVHSSEEAVITSDIEMNVFDYNNDDNLQHEQTEPQGTVLHEERFHVSLSAEEKTDDLSSCDEVVDDFESLKDIAQRHMSGESLTDDELDRLADYCIFHIKQVLKGFSAEDSQIDEFTAEAGEFMFDIINPQLGSLIGHHGKTLESAQFLVNAVLSQQFGFKYRVYLDVESYKSRQRSKLEQLARKSAARARNEQRKIKLGFMSAYERRVVHMILNEEMGITTFSEGEDPYRRVVILPKKEEE